MALLIPGQPRTATIRALVFSDVFELMAEDLERVLLLWPVLREALTKTMQERLLASQEVREKVGQTVDKEIEGECEREEKWKTSKLLVFRWTVDSCVGSSGHA